MHSGDYLLWNFLLFENYCQEVGDNLGRPIHCWSPNLKVGNQSSPVATVVVLILVYWCDVVFRLQIRSVIGGQRILRWKRRTRRSSDKTRRWRRRRLWRWQSRLSSCRVDLPVTFTDLTTCSRFVLTLLLLELCEPRFSPL